MSSNQKSAGGREATDSALQSGNPADSALADRYVCSFCRHFGEYSGTGPHSCPGCGSFLHHVPTLMRAAAPALARGAALEEVIPPQHGWPLRIRLALVAAWEVESLATLLMDRRGEEFACEDRAQRSILNRIVALSSVTMSALSDKAADPAELQGEVFPRQECDFGGAA